MYPKVKKNDLAEIWILSSADPNKDKSLKKLLMFDKLYFYINYKNKLLFYNILFYIIIITIFFKLLINLIFL